MRKEVKSQDFRSNVYSKFLQLWKGFMIGFCLGKSNSSQNLGTKPTDLSTMVKLPLSTKPEPKDKENFSLESN